MFSHKRVGTSGWDLGSSVPRLCFPYILPCAPGLCSPKLLKPGWGPLRIPNGFSDWNELRICISNKILLKLTFGKELSPQGIDSGVGGWLRGNRLKGRGDPFLRQPTSRLSKHANSLCSCSFQNWDVLFDSISTLVIHTAHFQALTNTAVRNCQGTERGLFCSMKQPPVGAVTWAKEHLWLESCRGRGWSKEPQPNSLRPPPLPSPRSF